ncbi:MAG TPA: TonB-dependent receptor [Devosia sp.]|nr:TonB-dependent receptor [Devosia sp.]
MRGLLFSSTAVAAIAAAVPAAAQTTVADASPAAGQQTSAAASSGIDDSVQDIVVTGNRGKPRTIADSPTPIDVIDGSSLSQLGGSLQLRDVLSQLVPSFQAMQVGSSSFSSVSRPAGLRGLSGVHVLVLVNGKRRHNSSLIDINSGSVSAGGNPVDLDQIPVSAIARIEVLRDGAAAQYGSDAIAGVINIILKDNTSGGTASIEAGQRYGTSYSGSDGETVSAQISHGFHLGEKGFLTLSMDAKKQNATIRNSIVPGTTDSRTYQGGLPKLNSVSVAENMAIPLSNVELYSNATLGYRKALVGQAGRTANSTSNILSIYPDGFTPFYVLHETDFQFTGGMRGDVSGWSVDLSSTYGRDYSRNGSDHSLNASLGEASPTSFNTFSAAFDQWTNNLDVTKGIDVLGGRNLQVSAGLEYRYESYVTKVLDEAAYENGGYIYPVGSPQAGKPAAVGAQGAVVLTPDDQADIKRNSGAAYLDLALDVTKRLLVTAAARYEDYDDSSGHVWSGKVSARYRLFDWLNLRGAFSNGFRAPSLAQQAYAQTSTQYNLVGGTYQLIQSKTVRSGSAIAAALGAKPLKPERSRNYSLGFALTPLPGLSLTTDAYQIDLDHRITLTGLLSGSGVSAILEANGFSGDESVRYFTNAIDTRTRGIDVVGSYRLHTARVGVFNLTAAYNYNKTTIRHIEDNPAELEGLGLTLFDRQTQGYFTVTTPHDKLILGVDWSLGKFDAKAKETRYGVWTLLNNNPTYDQSYGAKWITDLEVGYEVLPQARLSVGAYDVFDTYPDKNTVSSSIGGSPYGAFSPFGAYGGYYYMRLDLKL